MAVPPVWRPALPPTMVPGPPPAVAVSNAAWDFSILDRNEGPQITYAGSLLSTGSPFTCVSPDWKTVHHWMVRDPVRTEQAPGHLAISSDPAAPTAFTLTTMSLEATGPTAMRFTVDGHLDAEVPAKIEYIPLCIPAALVTAIETGTGERLPIGAALTEVTTPTPRLRICTRSGTIDLSVADGVGLTILDRREKPFHLRQVFLVMVGAFADQPKMIKGRRFHHVLDVSLPNGFRSGPDLTRISPAPAARALPAQPAEVPARTLTLCPEPRSVAYRAGRTAVPSEIVIEDAGLGDGERIAALFADALATQGIARPVRCGSGGWIRLSRIAAPAAERWDYHRLSVSERGVTIEAVSSAAASYALGTLAQLIDDGAVRLVTVEDWADFRYRGLHVMASDRDALAVDASIIRRIMVPLRLNQILLECKYVQWPSQPAIHHPLGMPYEDFKRLIGYAEDRFVTAIPCLNTYGHSEYLFYGKANLDIAEDPAAPCVYDVSNPRTYEVIGGILDDLRAAAPKAPWIHIGHDEVTMYGRYPNRPANLGKSLGELLTRDLAFYQAWASRHGTALMLWSDYLAGRTTPETRNDLQAVIDTLDRSAVVAMWDYEPKEEYAECAAFLSRGVQVFGATGEEDVRNITTFARYAKKQKLPGMMHTTWTGYTESLASIYRWPRKLWPYIQAGLTYWNTDAPVVSRQTPSRATAMYDRLTGDLFPEVRRIAPGDRIQPIDLATVADRSIAEPGGFAAGMLRTRWGGCFVLPGNATGAAGALISRGGSLRIPIGCRARALSLLWAGLATDPSVREIGTLAIAGEKPSTAPIIVRRQIGNLLHGLVTITDNANGALLTRADDEQSYAIARPVFAPTGTQVLWQYDLDLGGAQIDLLTITAGKDHDLILVGASLVE